MKISVELSDSELKEICQITGEVKKGPAIRKLILDALRMSRRAKIAEKFISGEWGVDLATFEAAQSKERKKGATRSKSWRE